MIKVNIGIRGAYGEQNFGDDALMLFIYQWALNNNLDVHFIGRQHPYIYKLIPEEKYIFKEKWHKYYFDTLILGGGTQFFSFQKSLKGDNKFNLFFLNPVQFFRKLIGYVEKKFIYKPINYNELYALGIGLGPFIKNSRQEALAMTQIPRMKGLFVRDHYSYSFANPLNSNAFKGTDICFLSGLYDFSEFTNSSKTINKIGIIVRDWNYSEEGNRYLENLLKQTKQISNATYEVVFILFKDEVECEKQINLSGYDILKWNPNHYKLEDFIKELSIFDLFISARFHGVIFGALLGIPSISIEIEPKLRVTKELLNNGVFIWEQPFNSDLLELIEGINYQETVKSLNKAVEQQKLVAKDMFEKLYEYIA